MKSCLEYIWIDAKNELRCKTKVLYKFDNESLELKDLPNWNYDGINHLINGNSSFLLNGSIAGLDEQNTPSTSLKWIRQAVEYNDRNCNSTQVDDNKMTAGSCNAFYEAFKAGTKKT